MSDESRQSPGVTQEMLDFCAEHNIAADVEVIGADQVNEAYERVLASDVRRRVPFRAPRRT